MMFNSIISAHQPNFLPNLGFIYKILQADTFVLITNIQFEKQEGWQRRNKIQSPNGSIWLTVPVLGSQNQMIKDVKIDNSKNWKKKHKKTFQLIYGKSKEQDVLNEIYKIYDSDWERLSELNIAFINLITKSLDIQKKIVIDEEVSGEKQDILINICKKYNASTYLSGSGAKSYMTQKYFSELEKNNLSHEFVKDNPSKNYPLSAIHYILTEGADKVNHLLKIGSPLNVKEISPIIK